MRLERSTAPDVLAYEASQLHLQHRIDSTATTPWKEEEIKKDYLGDKSIVLDNVEVEGRRKYIEYCTFQAFDAAKDAELIIDKGEYTYMVSDYLIDKGYSLTYWDGTTYEQYLSEALEGNATSSAIRSKYIEWLIRQSTINDFRTL